MAKKHSILQKDILRFYREYLKFAYSKPEPLRSNLADNIKAKMRASKEIPRTKINYIEFQLRMERNKFEMLQ